MDEEQQDIITYEYWRSIVFFYLKFLSIHPKSSCSNEKPVKWRLLEHELQWITISFKPCSLTFASTIEYVSSVQSSGDMATPHLGHAKSPFPFIFVKSNLYACVCFIYNVSFACFLHLLRGKIIN